MALGHMMAEESCRTEGVGFGAGAGSDHMGHGFVDVVADFGRSWEWHQMHRLADRMLVVLGRYILLETSCYCYNRSCFPAAT